MSTQSGIIPSQALISKFNDFVISKNRALSITININDLSIDISNEFESNINLNSDLDLISQQLLNDIDCMYLILNYNDENGKFAFISYVPDNATVRNKMLYASSKNTLLRSLGSDNFNPILFINHSDELNSIGWQNIIKNFGNDLPLTESEINLKNVKDEELLNVTSNSISKSKLVNDSNNILLFQIDSELEGIISSNNSNSLISLEISNEILKLIDYKTDLLTFESIIPSISNFKNPAYHLYVNKQGDQYFILTCPSGSKVRDRMVYAANKRGLVNHLNSIGWNFTKVIEAGDADEIDISEFDTAITTTKTTTNLNSKQLKFAKPKGPKRR